MGIITRLKKRMHEIRGKKRAEADKTAHTFLLENNIHILAELYGLARSVVSGKPEAADGSPLPWYTYPAIEYFGQLDADGLNFFEFGCGNSSLFWSARGANLWCVDHDPEWHAVMTDRAAAAGNRIRNVMLRTEKRKYANAVHEQGISFDVIIIDGAWRNQCAAEAVSRLNPGGMIILDNSDWYTDVSSAIRSRGFLQVDFSGFGPCNPYCWTTSLLIRAENRVLTRSVRPIPIGGITIEEKGETW